MKIRTWLALMFSAVFILLLVICVTVSMQIQELASLSFANKLTDSAILSISRCNCSITTTGTKQKKNKS